MSDDDPPALGPCCICLGERGVRNVICLHFKAVVPGRGWGCVVCDLPADGAVAVVCNDCIDDWQAGAASLRYACRGYPATDGRVPIEALTVPHEHDLTVPH
jgi:hypothetical protein